MSLEFDLFYSFRSPYSYLVTGRIVELTKKYDVSVNFRPVYPLAVRKPDFFKDVNPLWPRYVFTDIIRISQMLEIPLGWPQPDPIVQDPETLQISKDQPYIYRLVRLGVAAALEGKGLAFADEVSRVIWTGEVKNWHEGDHLAKAVACAGMNLEEMDRAIEARPEYYDGIAAENQKALEEAGHWGVPTMVFKGEPFFGQDRLDLLVWRMKQHGLADRK
ncbi:MAG: DsbA family protein [Thermodesulfobacteriota bacterium]